jgi:hypothetical protein
MFGAFLVADRIGMTKALKLAQISVHHCPFEAADSGRGCPHMHERIVPKAYGRAASMVTRMRRPMARLG